MFYNIKIKANGSEFSLESNNKAITQREMDSYFAMFFDVSKEFKETIKPVEITKKEVKSITELDNSKNFETENNSQIKSEPIQEPVQEVIQEPAQEEHQKEIQEPVQEKITEEIIEKKPNDKELTLEEKIEQLAQIRAQEILEKRAQEEVYSLKDNEDNEDNKESEKDSELISIKEVQNQEFLKEEKVENEIDELINLAESRINSLEPKTRTIESLTLENIPQNKIENTSDLKEVKFNNNEIISLQNDKEEENIIKNIEQVFEIQTPTEAVQLENNINSTPEISLADIESSLNNEINSSSIKPIEVIGLEEEPVQNVTEPVEEIKEEKPHVNPIELDFKPFLSSYACDNIEDEFIICAFFIKNVLRQDSFTMKFINAKLFQATGKIANMSVVDELITKEYIKNIVSPDANKYSITMDGETYFATKFQG